MHYSVCGGVRGGNGWDPVRGLPEHSLVYKGKGLPPETDRVTIPAQIAAKGGSGNLCFCMLFRDLRRKAGEVQPESRLPPSPKCPGAICGGFSRVGSVQH